MMEYIQTGLDYINMVPGPAWLLIGGALYGGFNYVRKFAGKGQADQRTSLFTTISNLIPQTAMWQTDGDNAIVSTAAGVRICFNRDCEQIKYGDKDITKTLYPAHASKLIKRARRLHSDITENKAQMEAANVNLGIQQKVPAAVPVKA